MFREMQDAERESEFRKLSARVTDCEALVGRAVKQPQSRQQKDQEDGEDEGSFVSEDAEEDDDTLERVLADAQADVDKLNQAMAAYEAEDALASPVKKPALGGLGQPGLWRSVTQKVLSLDEILENIGKMHHKLTDVRSRVARVADMAEDLQSVQLV